MQYLTDIDLQTGSYQIFLDNDPAANMPEIIDSIEAQNIALIRAKLNGRYDTGAIFSATGPDRHWLIVKILVKLVLYDLFRRNAARKIPEDIRQDWEWAMEMLEKIKAGTEVPEGLPELTTDDGESPNILFDNRRNDNFYI